MGLPVEIVSATAVKRFIASQILVDEGIWSSSVNETVARDGKLGSVRLHPHQISAVPRISAALEEFGGALLCDEVGMGKTFVALAIAKLYPRRLVVAPAVLRDMWSQQSEMAGVPTPFMSYEQLSRGRFPGGEFDLVVLDEAHHARNPATRRYRELSRVLMKSQVLLLSATPMHNSRRDLTALFSLFLGSRSESLSGSDLGRCVIRREIEAAGLASQIPDAGALVWIELPDDRSIPEALMSLPPPLPAREAGVGGVLVARALIRQWCSSDAALEAALRRRLGRSLALIAALESGHYPSELELSAWTIGEDSMQLAFPSLVARPARSTDGMLETIRAHHNALREVLRSLKAEASRDAERAHVLSEIRRRHPGVPVVAFSQYAETVNALFRELRRERGVASLTAKGARVAGGLLSRREAISRFAPRATGARIAREAERIDLLLATDLLSEGMNLQDAGVVVHLDLPWTAARLEQRLGRVARLGSQRSRVFAYGIRPSASAELLIRMESTIRRKMRESENLIGGMHQLLPEQSDHREAAGSAAERIRAILERWLRDGSATGRLDATEAPESTLVASVQSEQQGFVALARGDGKVSFLASNGARLDEEPVFVLSIMKHCDGVPVEPRPMRIADALAHLTSHARTRRTVGVTDDERASVARVRRAALKRLSAIVERARPHERARLRELGESARAAILGRMNVAAESELARMSAADISDEEWLAAVTCYQRKGSRLAHPAETDGRASREPRILAILLLDDLS